MCFTVLQRTSSHLAARRHGCSRSHRCSYLCLFARARCRRCHRSVIAVVHRTCTAHICDGLFNGATQRTGEVAMTPFFHERHPRDVEPDATEGSVSEMVQTGVNSPTVS